MYLQELCKAQNKGVDVVNVKNGMVENRRVIIRSLYIWKTRIPSCLLLLKSNMMIAVSVTIDNHA